MIGIATEPTDVRVHPLKSFHLVFETIIQAWHARQKPVWTNLEQRQLVLDGSLCTPYSVAECDNHYITPTGIDERRAVVVWVG